MYEFHAINVFSNCIDWFLYYFLETNNGKNREQHKEKNTKIAEKTSKNGSSPRRSLQNSRRKSPVAGILFKHGKTLQHSSSILRTFAMFVVKMALLPCVMFTSAW